MRGEVLIEVQATGICCPDYSTLSGADLEGIFPAIPGHEGAGVDVGPGAALSAAAMRRLTAMKLSGLTETESIPHATRNSTNAG